MLKISRITICLFLFTVFLLVSRMDVQAAGYTRVQAKLDTTISDQTTRQYSQPVKILISQISSKDQLLESNSLAWYRTLYYYSITRLGYVDIPFTYVIDREGNIYDGRDGGDNVSPELVNDQGAIVIGYLSNSTDLPSVSEDALQALVTRVSYTYGIAKKNVEVVSFEIVKSEGRSSKSNPLPVNNLFSQNVLTALDNVIYSEKEHITYKAKVASVNYGKSVKAGEKLKVEVSITNENDFPWFTTKDYLYVTTKGSKDSQFAVNGVWDSFSKPVSVKNKTILPGETIKLTYDLQALLLPGKYTESYSLLKSPNIPFKNTEFKVSFEITKGDFKLVQVAGTPAGILNVRECPAGSCKSISTLTEGQVVIMVEKSLAGWYRVKYADRKEGWVYAPYIKEL
ncbi:MAG: N-acetylmuramoyl-L-alanine amidase family 2 [candidate division WS6 bacterium GW2011_GWF2_39_15]|uniref:N-acetylmuramoyl-L-alanine amidase family 2 n=1 Tax=candidate division WS6 bacterium GW2011_GWF2_39_15 TaxID=1619100 RepID=A0A0G0QVJ3_9BACT|nr:MAG: N-acetylmuramoyl-L-alanine amidase family 2 [candidate division WS6 bacterium GW2011_GWF2_39_15]